MKSDEQGQLFSWMHPALEVRATGRYGQGVFATKDVASRSLVAMFGGYVLTLAEETALPEKYRDCGIQVAENLVLVNTGDSEMDRFNHSCEPNAGIQGQIALVAMRNIRTGEEITFDYAMVLFDGAIPYRLACQCGAESCRGYVTGADWQRPDLQARYDGYFTSFLQEKINRQKG